MPIDSNYSITHLFFTKSITVIADKKSFTLQVPTLSDFYTDSQLNGVYHMWTSSIKSVQKMYVLPLKTPYDIFSIMVFDLGKYDRYRELANNMRESLLKILPQAQIDMANHQVQIGKVTMTPEI